jgi:hypothetical protein
MPSTCTRRVWSSMTNATYRRLSVNAQSTWKKSAARSVAAWARRKTRQDRSCPDGGGMRWARRILRMVEAATRCPSRRSSPWILTTPHRVFSRARRRISATSSSGTGGRPGGLGWRHFAATRRRCQRSSAPGVTMRRARSALGMFLVSAARTARPVQDIRGLGVVRRSTATSCRSASISTSLADEDRASSASQDSTVTSSR